MTMRFLDKDGREMTEDEVRDAGCGYLLDQDPYSICDVCCCTTVGIEQVQCPQTQDDGEACPGQLHPVTTFLHREVS